MSGLLGFAQDELGLSLYPGQREVLNEWESEAPPVGIWRMGRRSGKGVMASAIALYTGTVQAPMIRSCLRPGERFAIPIVATAERQATTATLEAVRTLIAGSRSLQSLVVSDTETEISLSTGCLIRALPCSARSTRGLAAPLIVFDELAWMVSETEGFQAGQKVYQALSPSVAQFGSLGRILCTSTPNGRAGVFWQLASRTGSAGIREWHRSTAAMNPTIPRAFLEQQRALDPDAYAMEYEAEWGSGVAALFSSEAIEACVALGVRERAPRAGVSYRIALDPGFMGDSFAAAVACEVGDTIHVDAIREWRGTRQRPVQMAAVLAEVRDLAERYGNATVGTDQHSAAPVIQALDALGVRVDYQPWTAESKARCFSVLKARLNVGAISLVEHPGLVAQLRAIETRPGGRFPRIGAPSGQHDDLAVAVAACVGDLDRPYVAAASVAMDPPDPENTQFLGRPGRLWGARAEQEQNGRRVKWGS